MILLMVLTILPLYVGICVTVRCRACRRVHDWYYDRRGASLNDITLEDAAVIQRWLAEQEFPTTLSIAVFFALFKTYGIPSISSLLVSNGHMTTLQSLARRMADTSQLLNNAIIAPPTSDRAIDAVTRIAHLHHPFRQKGQISDDDMLYTLSLFALKGMRWVRKYEWRELTDLERCAIAVFWRHIGHDFGIPYTLLECDEDADALQWLQSLDAWSQKYEAQHMRYAKSNAVLAQSTLRLLVGTKSARMQRLLGTVAAYLMGSRLCDAMGVPSPSPRSSAAISYIVQIRKIFLRFFALPRLFAFRKHYIALKPSSTHSDRYYALRSRAAPWYIRPTWTDRLKAWWKGLPQPGSPYRPEGYHLLSLGPDNTVHYRQADLYALKSEITARRQAF
ncbi:hypothetical protein LTR95_001734 [Oleoguttula sp. CCFEE 5521]